MKLSAQDDISVPGKSRNRAAWAAEIGYKRHRLGGRWAALLAVTVMVFALSACNSSEKKSYDISPIFPLTSNKCAKYDGQVEGTGILAYCWVTKSQCQQAVTDWQQAMKGIPDAINFRC